MRLKSLLQGLDYELIQGSIDTEVNNVNFNSKEIADGDMFICIKGYTSDGHKYVDSAINNGAKVILCQDNINVSSNITVIKVLDTRYAMAIVSSAYFDNPSKKLKVIGVTGTKGKTTTAYMIKAMLEAANYKVGLIGTIETIIGDKHIQSENTTPESFLIHKYFDDMVKNNIQVVVMEVSSQGLMLYRTAGIEFDYGIFTNISPDHIGPNEHKDFEEYMNCKGMLFKQCKVGIINADDIKYKDVIKGHTCEIETYGLSDKADLRANNIHLINGNGFLGIEYKLSGLINGTINVDIPGKFSVYNSLTAIAIARHFNISMEIITKALKEIKVKGRIEIIPISKEYTLMIDYAHNAMSLESILTTLREYNPKRLVCLFGCGGDRSKLRRFEMGEVSGNLADLTVVTSDNPRSEDPQAIVNDIKVGVSKTKGEFVEILDRKEAIKYVISKALPGDVIVLAGKGHEDYQILNTGKIHFDEREVIKDIVNELQL